MSRYSDDTLVLTLVRQAWTVLDELRLPESFTLDALHRRLEIRRGRRIHLISHQLPAQGPHGVWVAGTNDDYVFYDRTAPPIRRQQIIGHEFGHIVYNDEGTPIQPERLAALLPAEHLPIHDASVNARALAACTRTAYDEMTEQRCEWFGTVVVQRLTTQGHGVI
jgi:hypothetical protein